MPETPAPPDLPPLELGEPPPSHRLKDQVYRSADAVLLLSPDVRTLDDKKAEKVIQDYELTGGVGKLTGVTLRVSRVLRPFYELGRRSPTDLSAGTVRITGTAERAFLNGALINLLLGDWSRRRGDTHLGPPGAFNIIVFLTSVRVNVYGARLDGWDFSIPMDDFIMERVSFQAMEMEYEIA